MEKRVLILSQVIPQWYVDVIVNALGEDTCVDFVTGSKIKGNIIKAPEYNPSGFVSRFVTWAKYYLFTKKWAKKNKNTHYDLIFATSNPPINSFLGLALKKIFKCPFVMMNWDIYPQCIDKMIKNPLVHVACNVWHWFNSKNYPKIDQIITIGDVVAQSINEPLKTKIDIEVIPIAVDTNELIPRNKTENIFCTENNLQNKFIVLYSGKMGYGHNIELILEAAEKLREYEEICFVFIGDGQKYGLVKEFCEKAENSNTQLYPFQPNEMFPYSMACGDIGIVSEELEMARLFMPSKTYSMMSCGMAVIGICSDDDDLHNVIVDKGVGACITDNDGDKLAGIILDLYNNREKLNELKQKARACAVADYDMAEITRKYAELFGKYI